MDKPVSILIPTRFNNRWSLELCLKTIRKYTDYPYKIIVGDAGADKEAIDFLNAQDDIQIVKCPDPIRPKDYLARISKTPYFVFLHDDTQILRHGWLKRRINCMEKDPRIGVIGVVVENYIYGYKRYLVFRSVDRRFFPLGMLVRKEVQNELDLVWGEIQDFDSGAIAYLQFLKQKKWRFVRYKFDHDIQHWGGMTWIFRKKLLGEKTGRLNVDNLIEAREKKVAQIKQLLVTNSY